MIHNLTCLVILSTVINPHFPNSLLLVSSKEKLRCRQEQFEARYCQITLHTHFEMCTHQMLFSFYPFEDEQELKLPHSAEKNGRS